MCMYTANKELQTNYTKHLVSCHLYTQFCLNYFTDIMV